MVIRLRYRFSEAADVLSVSRSKIEEIVKEGGLTVHADCPGGDRYISLESLQNYIRDRETQPVIGRRMAR